MPTLAQVLAQGNDANTFRIENLAAPNSGDDAMRFDSILRGSVSSAGAIVAGTGFSVVRNGVGDYTVTFTTPFASAPLVVGCCITTAGARIFTIDTIAAGSFHVFTIAHDGIVLDVAFNFLAMLYV